MGRTRRSIQRIHSAKTMFQKREDKTNEREENVITTATN